MKRVRSLFIVSNSEVSPVILFSILGALIVIIGLYFLLWGKEGDGNVNAKSEEELEDNNYRKNSSAQKEALNGEP